MNSSYEQQIITASLPTGQKVFEANEDWFQPWCTPNAICEFVRWPLCVNFVIALPGFLLTMHFRVPINQFSLSLSGRSFFRMRLPSAMSFSLFYSWCCVWYDQWRSQSLYTGKEVFLFNWFTIDQWRFDRCRSWFLLLFPDGTTAFSMLKQNNKLIMYSFYTLN